MIRTGLALSLTLAAAGCSSGDVAVGSSQQALKKTPNGGATGNGSACSWDDSVSNSGGATTPSPNGAYNVGATFKSTDGCNDCSCTAQGIACTLRACAPGGGGDTCSYGGKSFASGASFPSIDNCNTCSCQASGDVVCTERACAPAPTDCKKTGCSGEVCSDQDLASACLWTAAYACYQTATCERQASGQCGFTETAQLTQCLATGK